MIMIPISLALYLAALVCFIMGAIPVSSRVNLMSVGLALAMLGFLSSRLL